LRRRFRFVDSRFPSICRMLARLHLKLDPEKF
jgi:hypothetical protein